MDKLEFLELGHAPDGKPVYLKDIGYFEVGYDRRRNSVDLDGNGEVVGGIVVMEQNRNVLAATRSVEERLRQICASTAGGIDIVTTYARSDWIWATLRQFFETLLIEQSGCRKYPDSNVCAICGVGGVFFQWILGYSMTTAVIVGYISLFAVAVQTGIIMVIFIRAALENRAAGPSYIDAVIAGSAVRLRPKLMTVAVIIIMSLLPVLVSNGPGMKIMKPVAAPSIGGTHFQLGT